MAAGNLYVSENFIDDQWEFLYAAGTGGTYTSYNGDFITKDLARRPGHTGRVRVNTVHHELSDISQMVKLVSI
jgi:hypothetical protein